MKRTGAGLRRGGPIRKKVPSPAQVAQNKEDTERMWQLFNEHWEKKKNLRGFHRCENCGCAIYGENRSLYHHHLLPKGLSRYVHLKYEIDNLMLLCTGCHISHENGTKHPAIQERTEQAKVRFNVM